ncbi:IS256 family transposase [Leptospira santarosai serovar Guaricura]|uniref:IS256 family transposase n=5 Tax=Leptospira santarosai TaxID=28183 RepID=UPI00096A08B3|nr:IS256 family transposase [Leptospira santarosai]OLY59902.1 IS256 family transposase [Leptospira santarosai serovar Guaricura]
MSKPQNRAEELLDELIKGKTPEELLGKEGLLKQLTKSLIERAMQGEMTHHLGYEKNSSLGNNSGNSRNGKSSKKLKGDFGTIDLEVPRDRNGSFEPQIIQKGQTRFTGFDDKIISMYSRGMTTREISQHLQEIYQVEVSADLISGVTDSVMTTVIEWQNRPLDKVYPILIMDALVVKVRDGNHVQNKAFYLAVGINLQGAKEILGIWVERTEGAKFWLQILTDLKNRGVEDILIACVDGLKGFPDTILSVFPNAQIQLCIVHMVRNALKWVSYKQRKELVIDLKAIYKSPSAEIAKKSLDDFSTKWDSQYPMNSKSWRSNWESVIPFLAYPPNIRKAIYTTNAIESMNMGLRKIIKNRGSFPTDEAAIKLLYLALNNMSKKWTMPIQDWGKAMNQFAIIFGDRLKLDSF